MDEWTSRAGRLFSRSLKVPLDQKTCSIFNKELWRWNETGPKIWHQSWVIVCNLFIKYNRFLNHIYHHPEIQISWAKLTQMIDIKAVTQSLWHYFFIKLFERLWMWFENILYLTSTHGIALPTKFHSNRAKLVDLLLLANSLPSLISSSKVSRFCSLKVPHFHIVHFIVENCM